MDEVVQSFTAQVVVEVTIKVEMKAKKTGDFDGSLQRTVKENATTLEFNNAEFEES